MQIIIQSKGVDIDQNIKNFVDNHMRFVFTRYGEYVICIEVMLIDINGPKGGIDKRCRVKLKLGSRATIVIQETQEDLYSAIKLCSARLKRSVERSITRHYTNKFNSAL